MTMLWVAAIALAGSVLPFSPIEPVLVGLPWMVARHELVGIALIAAVAHMAGKVVLFYGSERLVRLLPAPRKEALEKARLYLEGRPLLRNVSLFVSASVGVPPFYAVTVVAGALKISLATFLVIGLAGRSVRFLSLVLLPTLFTD